MRERTTHTSDCRYRGGSRTQLRRGVSVVEVAAAVALFMVSVGVLTAVITSALSSRLGAEDSMAVDAALGRLVTSAATVPSEAIASGSFNVPDLCADLATAAPDTDFGAAGESCIAVGQQQYRVYWTVRFAASSTTAATVAGTPQRAGWIELTARTRFDGLWRSRSASTPLPPLSMIEPTPTPGAGDTLLLASPLSVRQGSQGVLVVTAVDAAFNPRPDFQVQVTPSGQDPQQGITDAEGRAAFTVDIPLDASVGLLAVTVAGGPSPTTVNITVTPRPVTLAVAVPATAVGEGATTTVAVAALGALGENVPGVTVTASTSSNAVRVTPRVTTDANGVAVFTLFRPAGNVGEVTVTFTAGGGLTAQLSAL
jgi:hypothetical protein